MDGKITRGLIAIVLMLLTAVAEAQAGELRIIETEEGIIAEYTGTAAETTRESDKPSAIANNADEIQQQTVREQSKIADSPKPNEELPVKQKNFHQERKRQMKALRDSRPPSPSSANQE